MDIPSFTPQQNVAFKLLQNDLRYIYTIIMINSKVKIKSNYLMNMLPFLGLLVDGAEDWVNAVNKSSKAKISAPSFTKVEEEYYAKIRSSIKLWEDNYPNVYSKLEQIYQKEKDYFSSLCKPNAKELELYDIFGVDVVDGEYCGNTILCAYYSALDVHSPNVGNDIKNLSIVGGKYISSFNAIKEYNTNNNMTFSDKDYGGFFKSPVGNNFSYKFVLLSILCEINFVLLCVDKYILEECSTKLRFAYLRYFYMTKIISEINKEHSTSFSISPKWCSDKFRNAMAHYKIGVSLKPDEIIYDDIFYGLTQKYFNCDYFTVKKAIISELFSLAEQIKSYLGI